MLIDVSRELFLLFLSSSYVVQELTLIAPLLVFIGPDDTETCALHAAAFNGAEKVLQFLCGGIDEHDPGRDCGLCDVNVKDAK